MPDKVAITLAHPLSKARAAELQADEVRDYKPNEKITVPTGYGRNIIQAGLAAGVNPYEPGATEAALAKAAVVEAAPAEAKPASKTK